MRGGCEATSTGAARLRRMAAAGSLGFPMIAAELSAITRMIDHKYGTGQSVLDGILRATNTLVAGKTVVVAGFGPCGSGIAERARGLGAQVLVTEVDPVRALGAIMQGFRVMPMSSAAPAGEMVITATGSREVIGAAEIAALPDGAMLANAGHFDVEIDVAALSRRGRGGAPGSPAARGRVRARRRQAAHPAGRGPGREPGRGRGQPGGRHGHLVCRAGARAGVAGRRRAGSGGR